MNTQWQEYWVQLFAIQGYSVIDCIRPQIRNNEDVPRWYSQNMLLFIAQDHLDDNSKIRAAYDRNFTEQLSIVHPGIYISTLNNVVQDAFQSVGVRKTL